MPLDRTERIIISADKLVALIEREGSFIDQMIKFHISGDHRNVDFIRNRILPSIREAILSEALLAQYL